MDPYYNETHFGMMPPWQPQSSPSLYTPPWQPTSTPQWGLNRGPNDYNHGYNQPPSTSQWGLNGGPNPNGYNQPPSTPSLCKPWPYWGPTSHYQPPSDVVMTPVHSVGSERNITDLVTKIQRVARGFLVRKCVKKMLKIKVELEEIKKKVNDEETVKMIKEVQMEGIKIDGNLTNLLLMLDSLRGFRCSALKGFRRSLVKRAVFLQEFVYQIQMGIEENEDGRAATKIQMVTRGYLVRESMRKMLKIKVELKEIAKKVSNEETMKIMKKEQEERIRMDGAIMDLLLRLDNVCVFGCSALRGFRRSLVKRAVFLQEFVDQIQMVNEENEDGDDGVREATKIQMVARGYLVRKSMKKMLKIKAELEEIEKKVNDKETAMIMKKEVKERIRLGETIMNLLLRLDSIGVFHCSPLKDLRKSLINKAIFLDEFVDQMQMASAAHKDEDVKVKEDEDEEMVEVEESVEEGDGGVDIDGDMLTKMMDENREMLRRIMDDSEKQTSILTYLTHRVEQLEIAFTCDKSRRYVDACKT